MAAAYSGSTTTANHNNKQAHLGNAYQQLSQELSSDKLKVVGGYTIGRVIGEGTFGSVHIATHRLTGTRCAVKKIPKGLTPQLTRELHHHRKLHHLHIVQLYEIIATETYIYLVTELCSGGELFDYLVERGRMLEAEARRIFGELAVAVGWMHKAGVVHRDLKLENVLLDGELRVKLGDLGFAREYQRGRLMETFCGTTGYASPEMLTGKKYLGVETDIWSMGIILYTLLCGGLPFDDDDERVMQELIIKGEYDEPEWLSIESRSLIRGMLQQDPSQRLTIEQILTHPWYKLTIPATPASPHMANTSLNGAPLEHVDSPSNDAIPTVNSAEFSQTEKTLELLHPASTPRNPVAIRPALPTMNEGEVDFSGDESSSMHLPLAQHSRTPSRTKRRSVSSTLSLERRQSQISERPEDYLGMLNTPRAALFSTASEKHLLNQLSDLGFDIGQLTHSVENDACDCSAATWWILRAKQVERGETDEMIVAKQIAAAAARRRERERFHNHKEKETREPPAENSPPMPSPGTVDVPTIVAPEAGPSTPPTKPPESPRANKTRSPSLNMLQRATSVLAGGSWKDSEERSTSPTKLTKPAPKMTKSSSDTTLAVSSGSTPRRTPEVSPHPQPFSNPPQQPPAPEKQPGSPNKRDSLWTQFRHMFTEDKRRRKREGLPVVPPPVVLSRGPAARAPHVNRASGTRRISVDPRPPLSRRSSSVNSRRSSFSHDIHLHDPFPSGRRRSLEDNNTPTSDRETSRPGSAHSFHKRESHSHRSMRSPSMQSDGSWGKTPSSPLHNYHRRPPSGTASTRIRHIKVIPEAQQILRSASYASSIQSNASSRNSSIDRGILDTSLSDAGERSFGSKPKHKATKGKPLRDVFQKDDEWEDEPSEFAGGLGQLGGRSISQQHGNNWNGTPSGKASASQHPIMMASSHNQSNSKKHSHTRKNGTTAGAKETAPTTSKEPPRRGIPPSRSTAPIQEEEEGEEEDL